MVLYRKYRPQTFAQVVGQDHIRSPLLAQLTGGKISHAYLFSGPRGTGKTSVARILAKAVNCQQTANGERQPARFGEPCNTCESCVAVTQGSYLDLIEIDAASNRGIDEIRDLREKIKLSPASGRFKVYIIDEAHMLTPEAFNALLKTLEEPPEHAIFILATTEPQKIPATIASRTTRFDFKVPNIPQIKEKLGTITKSEGWGLKEEVLEEIAKRAAGAFRDAEVLLEKIASVDPAASLEKTREILGKKETGQLVGLLELLEKGETRRSLVWLNNYLEAGGSVRLLAESILETLRKIILIKAGAGSLLEPIGEEEIAALESLAAKISKARLLRLTDLFNKAIEDLREATIPQLSLELAIVEATLGMEEKPGPAETAEATETRRAVTTEAPNELEPQKIATPEVVKKEDEIEATEVAEETRAVEEKIEAHPATAKEPSIKEEKILKKLQNNWGQFLKKLKPLNSSLEIFLRSAKPVDLDEDLLTIEFAYRFHKEKVEERKYREVVEKALEGFTGVPLRIRGTSRVKPPEPKKEDFPKKEDIDPAEVFSKLD